MIANNPHLQKKRCSKKGLGRSIMRRITEIPESVSRQCSREDKEGADHSHQKNNTSNTKKNHQDSNTHNTKSKEDSTKHRQFSLKKSHSTYDHLRGQSEKPNGISTEKIDVCENSIRNSVNVKKPGHQEAEDLEAVSAESVPLVCKSASAHNLSLDKKPLHPSMSVLQKSLSAIANSKDKSLGLSEKTKSLEDSDKYQRVDSNDKEGQKCAPWSEKEDYLEQQHRTSSPVEDTPKVHKIGIMKQQPINLMLGDAEKTIGALGFKDKFDIEEVCPWEMYDLTPTAVPSESKVQKHVSIAPLDSEKSHTSRSKSKSHNRSKTTEQGHHQSKQKSPGKSDLNGKDNHEQTMRDENAKKTQTVDLRTVNQGVITKQTGSSSQEKEHKTNPPVTEGKLPPPDGHYNSNNNVPHTLALQAEICPWEFEMQDVLSVNISKASPTSSSVSPLYPKDMPKSPSKKMATEMPVKSIAASARKDATEKEKGRGHEKDLDPKNLIVKMDKSKSAEVCSMVGDNVLAVPVNKGKSTSNQHGIDKCKLVEVCPWESLSTTQSEQDTDVSDSKNNTVVQKSNLVEICPWDYHGNTDGK